MLIALMPNQVGDYWEVIKEGLKRSGIPVIDKEGIDTYPNILTSLLNGELTAFLEGLETGEGIVDVKMTVVVGIVTDAFSLTKNLIIYSLWSIHGEDLATWELGLHSIKKFAKSQECQYVLGYSDSPTVIGLGKRLDGDVSQTLIKFTL